jgi:dihydroneopterin aldolase
MTNIIRIKKASFYGYHGVMSEEKSMGGKFEADVDLYTDFSRAAEKDSLKETINYHEVYKLLYHVVLEEKHYLIETLAVKVADTLLAGFPGIQKVAVRIRKNNPPLGGVTDCVEAEVIKSRDEL